MAYLQRAATLPIWFTLSVVSMLACDSGPGPLPATINCTGSRPGEACTTEGQWCQSSDECGASVQYCKCTDGTYECTDPYSPQEIESCTVLPTARCFLEGTGACDLEPVGGGSCGCRDGAWSCNNSCDGCPSSAPADGEACTTTSTCRYNGPPAVTCTCSGTFTCR
jgi:hypothetical protein